MMKNHNIVIRTLIIMMIFLLFSPAIAISSSAGEIYENVKESIGAIYSVDEEKNQEAQGSGVAVDTDVIATNCHVALAGNFLIVKINNETLVGKLFYYNKNKDFCLIQVTSNTLKPVNVRPSKSVKIGEDVFAIGNPEGYMKTISRGIVSNKIMDNGVELIQTDASISHGSSGGGLFDLNGNLIGITTSADKNGENIGFAIPTEIIISLLGDKRNRDAKPINMASQSSNQEVRTSEYLVSDQTGYKILGYYGNDKITLVRWSGGGCSIAIQGRYNEKPTSIALWSPSNKNGLYIFSRIASLEGVMKFLKWKNEMKGTTYNESKSFIYFDDDLYRLTIISVNNIMQPVYIFALEESIFEDMINLNYFSTQFYNYTQKDGMTTIKFGLDGFTEAYGAYKQFCQ